MTPILPRHAKWGSQGMAVFDPLRGDFMSPVIDVVDDLLAAGPPPPPDLYLPLWWL